MSGDGAALLTFVICQAKIERASVHLIMIALKSVWSSHKSSWVLASDARCL